MLRYDRIMPHFVLIHAPLAGPSTWSLVADELRRRGEAVDVPLLPAAEAISPPYVTAYAEAIARQIHAARESPLVLVAHSGAGLLLPAVRAALGVPPAAYVFVDAIVPYDGIVPDNGHFSKIAIDGMIPPFTDDMLRQTGLADAPIRAQLLSELRPLPLDVYRELVRVPPDWPDAPAAYLRFTQTPASAYQQFVDRARREGWPCRDLEGAHFHMLVDAVAVTDAIVDLVGAAVSTRTTDR
jgi:hypothetical protein